jgi:alpha-beta hydrolase superfamily lysophospholipase
MKEKPKYILPMFILNIMTKMTTSTAAAAAHPAFGVERKIEIPCSTFPNMIFPTADEIDKMESLLPGCQHGWFPSAYDNSIQLHYRKWIPSSGRPIKAVMVWMHGISCHSGVAFITKSGQKRSISLLSSELLKNDIALYAFDMYGHGYSEGTRALIPGTWEQSNKQDYINFLNTIVAADPEIANVPIFLAGESYGSCLTIHVARHFQDTSTDAASARIDSMILNAPAIIGDLPPAPVVFVLRYLLAPLFPLWIPFFMPNPVSPDRIWSHPEVSEHRSVTGRYMNMGIDMSGRPYRLGTGVNLILALEAVRSKAIPGLTVPYLCQHGTADHATPIAGSEYLYNQCATPDGDKLFIKHDGGYHDLLAEKNAAEKVVQNMLQWIDHRCSKLL